MIPSFLLIRSSNPTGLVLWCGIGLCAGIYLFVQGFRMLQRRQLILNTPVSKVRSAAMGMVELNGLAVGPYTMVAPITARPCYYYRTVVWEWKQSGKNKQWVKAAAECVHVPFFLDDNSGKVMVDPRGAELDLHRDFEQEFCDSLFTTQEEAPLNVRDFLARHGISTANKIKVEEFCIKPKNALFVLGTLGENSGLELAPKPIRDDEAMTQSSGNVFSFSLAGIVPGGSGWSFAERSDELIGGSLIGGRLGGAENQDERLLAKLNGGSLRSGAMSPESGNSVSVDLRSTEVIRLSPNAGPAKAVEMTQQQKIAAALARAGITNPAAWEAAGLQSAVVVSDANGMRRAPGDGAAQVQTQADGFEQCPRTVLMKGKNNPTFLISWRSQRDVARSLGWKCALMIWGGPAIALISLYGLLEMMNWI